MKNLYILLSLANLKNKSNTSNKHQHEYFVFIFGLKNNSYEFLEPGDNEVSGI